LCKIKSSSIPSSRLVKTSLYNLSSPSTAPCGKINREAGKIRELLKAKLCCKDLYFNLAIYTRVPDLSHRRLVRRERASNYSLQMIMSCK
jgi:hypothetical protein